MESRSGIPATALALLRADFLPRATGKILPGVAIALVAVLFCGCAGASPRFSADHRTLPDSSGTIVDTIGLTPEFKTEITEEIEENDKSPDITSVVLTIAALPSENPAIEHRKLIDEILSLLGTPYAYSGTDSLGIDCSGFTSRVFRNSMNLTLPHSSRQQYGMGRKIKPGERKLGDLLFFKTRRSGPSHVGIYLGEDLFAHASVSRGVTISSLESTYFKRRYLGARRLLE